MKMTKIGFGTWLITEYDILYSVIKTALENKYKLIDTAQVYNNEQHIGKILKELNVNTDEIFITTKVTPINYRFHTRKSLEVSLKKLGVSKVNLVLLHAEIGDEDNLIAYKELITMQNEGIIEHIGVSNFSIEGIQKLEEVTGVKPYCNQIVLSPSTRAIQLENYCKKNDIKLIGYSILKPYFSPNPFYPNSGLKDEEKDILDKMCIKYDLSISQLLNGWALQNGYYVIPKSVKKERVIENYCEDVEIYHDDMNIINQMNRMTTAQYKEMVNSWKTQITPKMYEDGYNLNY